SECSSRSEAAVAYRQSLARPEALSARDRRGARPQTVRPAPRPAKRVPPAAKTRFRHAHLRGESQRLPCLQRDETRFVWKPARALPRDLRGTRPKIAPSKDQDLEEQRVWI